MHYKQYNTTRTCYNGEVNPDTTRLARYITGITLLCICCIPTYNAHDDNYYYFPSALCDRYRPGARDDVSIEIIILDGRESLLHPRRHYRRDHTVIFFFSGRARNNATSCFSSSSPYSRTSPSYTVQYIMHI